VRTYLTTTPHCVSVPLRVQVCVRSFASAASDAPLLKTALYDEHVKLGGKMASQQTEHTGRRAGSRLRRWQPLQATLQTSALCKDHC
jgi:hypothetical protein